MSINANGSKNTDTDLNAEAPPTASLAEEQAVELRI
jgi:hypothetical protein